MYVCVCVYRSVYTIYIHTQVNDNGFFFLLLNSQNCHFSCPVHFGTRKRIFRSHIWFAVLYFICILFVLLYQFLVQWNFWWRCGVVTLDQLSSTCPEGLVSLFAYWPTYHAHSLFISYKCTKIAFRKKQFREILIYTALML